MSKFKSTSSLEVLLLWVWDTACLQDRRYMGAYNKTRYLQLERVLSGKRERHSHLIWESVLGFSTAPWPLTNLVICCSSHSCPEQYESGEPAGSGQWVNGVGKKAMPICWRGRCSGRGAWGRNWGCDAQCWMSETWCIRSVCSLDYFPEYTFWRTQVKQTRWHAILEAGWVY